MSTASNRPLPPDFIVVIDASAIIRIKTAVPYDRQWRLFRILQRLVEEGRVTFPRQVARELAVAKHPDAPGVWVGGVKNLVRYPPPSDESLAEVLDVAAQLVDVNDDPEREVADPYVVAAAFELTEKYPDAQVIVVTEDVVDRLPLKISMLTACERLSLRCERVEWFIDIVFALETDEDA